LAELAVAIEDEFGIDVQAAELGARRTLRNLAGPLAAGLGRSGL
jgi:acyl carrier protein